jgi:hypothetical protein
MLSQYHNKYANQPDAELQRRIDAKERELIAIKAAGVAPQAGNGVLKVGVMGCGDKRFVEGHRQIFASVFGRPVQVITMDISIEHLDGEANIIKHDITEPLPEGPYDVTYAHVVLKFIDESKQGAAVENSYSALTPGGVAIHVLDTEDYADHEKVTASGYHPVDLETIKHKLDEMNIKYREVPIEYGLALVLLKPGALETQ